MPSLTQSQEPDHEIPRWISDSGNSRQQAGNKQAYRDVASKAAALLKEFGATRRGMLGRRIA